MKGSANAPGWGKGSDSCFLDLRILVQGSEEKEMSEELMDSLLEKFMKEIEAEGLTAIACAHLKNIEGFDTTLSSLTEETVEESDE